MLIVNNFIVRVLSCFILSKNHRRKFREKYMDKNHNKIIKDLQNTIFTLTNEVETLYQAKMEYLLDRQYFLYCHNPQNIFEKVNQNAYIVDQQGKGNDDFDKYKNILFKGCFHPYINGLDKASAIAIRGLKFPKLKSFLLEAAQNRGIPAFFLEDGFIRSITSFTYNCFHKDNSLAAGISYVIDDLGFYFDGTRTTRIEWLLNSDLLLTEEQIKYARKMIKKIVDNNISKYNYQPLKKLNIGNPHRKKILVMEQSKGDYSIIKGLADENTFNYMLKCAINENPNCDILVKVHPDTLAKGQKKAYCDFSNTDNIYQISELINPISLIKQVDKVYVVSTQAGFEALMCGKEVHTFGMPFYAGWGLTIDQKTCSRRTRKRTLEEVFYIFYCIYTHYINPDKKCECSIDEAIDWIIDERNKYFKEIKI